LHIEESLIYYPIQTKMIKYNIRDVLDIARDREKIRNPKILKLIDE
jgi:hypothetical protein